MNELAYTIEPITVTKVNVLSKFVIVSVEVTLGDSAKIGLHLYDQYNIPFKGMFITISGDEYRNWGSDDTYLVNLIRQKLNISIIEPSAAESVQEPAATEPATEPV